MPNRVVAVIVSVLITVLPFFIGEVSYGDTFGAHNDIGLTRITISDLGMTIALPSEWTKISREIPPTADELASAGFKTFTALSEYMDSRNRYLFTFDETDQKKPEIVVSLIDKKPGNVDYSEYFGWELDKYSQVSCDSLNTDMMSHYSANRTIIGSQTKYVCFSYEYFDLGTSASVHGMFCQTVVNGKRIEIDMSVCGELSDEYAELFQKMVRDTEFEITETSGKGRKLHMIITTVAVIMAFMLLLIIQIFRKYKKKHVHSSETSVFFK